MTELLTLKEAAKKLRVTKMTARRWLIDGVIPGGKIGGVYRIPADDLEKFIADSLTRKKEA